jgi:hypothetical protein
MIRRERRKGRDVTMGGPSSSGSTRDLTWPLTKMQWKEVTLFYLFFPLDTS